MEPSAARDTEEQLVEAARTSRAAASELVARYLRTAEAMARAAAHRSDPTLADDLTQEGLMALLDAVKSFTPGEGRRFAAYAGVSMRNRMMSFLKKEGSPLTEVFDEELEEVIADTAPSPETVVIEKEELEELYRRIQKELSRMEGEVFGLFLGGLSYRDIAERLGIEVKAVSNSLQRVRQKLKGLELMG